MRSICVSAFATGTLIGAIFSGLYIIKLLNHDVHSTSSPKDLMSSSSVLSFCEDELRRALTEQIFGIRSFSITCSDSQQASASLTLLEGDILTVTLTRNGYRIGDPFDNVSPEPGSSPKITYETVEDLLHSISPLYVQKRQEALLVALQKLS